MSNEMNLPWNVYRINSIRGSIIDSERSTVTNHIDPARAAHIVRAVNSYDALVGALDYLLLDADAGRAAVRLDLVEKARAALKLARGEL